MTSELESSGLESRIRMHNSQTNTEEELSITAQFNRKLELWCLSAESVQI